MLTGEMLSKLKNSLYGIGAVLILFGVLLVAVLTAEYGSILPGEGAPFILYAAAYAAIIGGVGSIDQGNECAEDEAAYNNYPVSTETGTILGIKRLSNSEVLVFFGTDGGRRMRLRGVGEDTLCVGEHGVLRYKKAAILEFTASACDAE